MKRTPEEAEKLCARIMRNENRGYVGITLSRSCLVTVCKHFIASGGKHMKLGAGEGVGLLRNLKLVNVSPLNNNQHLKYPGKKRVLPTPAGLALYGKIRNWDSS